MELLFHTVFETFALCMQHTLICYVCAHLITYYTLCILLHCLVFVR